MKRRIEVAKEKLHDGRMSLTDVAAACGFTDVRVELRSPVDPAARLQAVPAEGLPPRAAEALNENIARLNGLLYGPQEYALLARR